MATQLPDLVARYVVAWCDALTKSASDSRSPRHAEALCALLRGLGRLFVPGVDLDALRAQAAPQDDRNHRTPQPHSGDALLAESVSRLRTSDPGAGTEAAADAQQALAAAEKRLVAAAAALPPAEAGAVLRGALHASGRFQLLADGLLTGAAETTLALETFIPILETFIPSIAHLYLRTALESSALPHSSAPATDAPALSLQSSAVFSRPKKGHKLAGGVALWCSGGGGVAGAAPWGAPAAGCAVSAGASPRRPHSPGLVSTTASVAE
jgi:hypothetical protein